MRPEFWTDGTVASLPTGARLFYIGLWCVADDYGWFRWNETDLAAQLFPFESPRRREKEANAWGALLLERGRVVRFTCGCAVIPTLATHQVNGGRKSGMYRDKHIGNRHPEDRLRVVPEVPEIPPVGRVGSNGRSSGTTPDEPTDFKSKMTAHGAKQP